MSSPSKRPVVPTDARGTIHVGNVADFYEQFFTPSFSAEHRASWRRESDHYACLAAFYSPDPIAVLVPLDPDSRWFEDIGAILEWSQPLVVTGLSRQANLADSIIETAGLVHRLRSIDAPLLAWGACDSLGRLASEIREGANLGDLTDRATPPIVTAVRAIESKAWTNRLFAEIGSKDVGVPWQAVARSVGECAREVLRIAQRGSACVVKAEYGVGGFGTTVVRPHEVTDLRAARALLDAYIEDDNIFLTGSFVVEEFIQSSRPDKDYTFDGYVLADGSVRTIDSAPMIVEGTMYVGATAGPRVVEPELAVALKSFGERVGHRLSHVGYRGWYDIDFVLSSSGQPFAIEINARRTGPTIAFSIRDRLNTVDSSSDHAVRTLDVLYLPRHLTEDRLYELILQLRAQAARHEVGVIPTLFTASTEADPVPYFGVALTCRDDGGTSKFRLDRAEALVRSTVAAI